MEIIYLKWCYIISCQGSVIKMLPPLVKCNPDLKGDVVEVLHGTKPIGYKKYVIACVGRYWKKEKTIPFLWLS